MTNILAAIWLLTHSVGALAHPEPAAPDEVRITHRLEIEERTDAGKWKLLPRGGSNSEILKFSLHPYRKGNAEGTTAILKRSLKGPTLFRSEVRVSTPASDPAKHYAYVMLRSGPTLRRHGKIANATLGSAREFSPVVLQDDPIEVNGKILRARLILTPAQ
jgi:hypothetical protein